jgi:hypothetical protein
MRGSGSSEWFRWRRADRPGRRARPYDWSRDDSALGLRPIKGGAEEPDRDDDREQPGALVGGTLPNADQAVIPPDKLAAYALDYESEDGKDKARVFEEALAITKADWQYLRDAILAELPNQPVTSTRLPVRPKVPWRYEVLMPITGLNGRRVHILTAWKLVDGHPQLVSTRVLRKDEQPAE